MSNKTKFHTYVKLGHFVHLRAIDSAFADLEAKGIANGITIGPNWLPSAGEIRECGDAHDLLYTIGGTEEDRQKADELLKYGIIRRAEKRGESWWGWITGKKKRGALAAQIYYDAVRAYGATYFAYKATSIVTDDQRRALLRASTDDGPTDIVRELEKILIPA